MSRLVYGWLTALMAGMPMKLGYFLARALTELHFRLFPERRHAALANLAAALPGSSRRQRLRIARRMMASYNRFLFEFFRLPHLDGSELASMVEFVGREEIERALARGNGVLLCTGHVGNWELAAVVLAQNGYTVHAVAGQQLNRWLTGAVRESKTEMAIHTISPEDGFRKILRALSRNEMVALMVDGDIYAHGTTVEFMGRETSWPAGPGVLAQRTGAQIITGSCVRKEPGRFLLRIDPVLDPAHHPSAALVNAEVAARIERHIREHIDQWCIFRPLWETAPGREAEPSAGAERQHA